jgi:hypothetical protein
MQRMFWYAQGTRSHVIFASTRAIARWYVGCSPHLRGATFVREDTRSATPQESTTVLAHAADKTLQDCYQEWCANGGSLEYRQTLQRLVAQIDKGEVHAAA